MQYNKHFCKYCGKGFQTPYNVVRHERTHTGERPFACSLCPQAFNQREVLKRHVISVHKIDGVS